MAKAQYIGVGGIARKVSGEYVGVSGIARKVKSGYIGTLGTLSVPYAIAAMACTPPALNILFTPANFAAYKIAG